jgi:hypothetical protein
MMILDRISLHSAVLDGSYYYLPSYALEVRSFPFWCVLFKIYSDCIFHFVFLLQFVSFFDWFWLESIV